MEAQLLFCTRRLHLNGSGLIQRGYTIFKPSLQFADLTHTQKKTIYSFSCGYFIGYSNVAMYRMRSCSKKDGVTNETVSKINKHFT